jgi:TonB family protein
MRQIFVSLGLFTFMANAQAQLGPSSARMVHREMPSRAPAAQTFAAEAELLVTRRGGVDSVKIVTSSGDESFDKQWKKSLSDWRFVPAVDDAGQTYESTVNVLYKPSGLTIVPGPAVGAAANDPVTRNAVSDSERIARMSCKDFLWEYEIVTNAMPRRLALLDPLLKTPLVMLMTESSVSEPQMRALRERYDEIVSDAAKQCRDNQESLFWKDVLKPALEAPPAQ